MIVASAPLLRGTAGTSREGSRKRRIVSQHQVARILLPCSGPDSVIEDSNPVSGKDCEVRSTLASPYLEAAVHSSNRFPIIFALGRGSSYDVLFASHFQTIQQGPTKTPGTHSTCSNVVAVVAAIAVHLQKAAFGRRCSVVEAFASAAPLVQP